MLFFFCIKDCNNRKVSKTIIHHYEIFISFKLVNEILIFILPAYDLTSLYP